MVASNVEVHNLIGAVKTLRALHPFLIYILVSAPSTIHLASRPYLVDKVETDGETICSVFLLLYVAIQAIGGSGS